jgi:Glycosyl transferase family 2.
LNKRIPIFIISYNRGKYLDKVISSYLNQTVDVDIIIHDNGSDDEYTIETLRNLEKSGVTVFRNKKISQPEELNSVDESIKKYFGWFRKRSRYVVTDCDIDLSQSSQESLAVYDQILDLFKDQNCVGPMLKIDDIPTDYPLYNHVMNRHIDQFWKQPPVIFDKKIKFAYIRAKIDTTFALHREGSRFTRLKDGIRVYKPYDATHLDWYQPEAENAYKETSSSAISHWNNQKYLSEHISEKIYFDFYYSIDIDSNGNLFVSRRQIIDC